MTPLSKGVAQILNRLDRKTFNDADQRLFEVRPLKTLLPALSEKHEIHHHLLCLFLVAGVCDILWTRNQQHYDVQSGQEDVGQAVGSAGCRPLILPCLC